MEEAMTKAQVDAGRRYNGDKNKSVSGFILHPKLTNPIPGTEQSLELKLARKVSKRSKRDLRGLWETLAPGSTVVRTSTTTTAIKEPGVREVKVHNSDIARFGTQAERNTELWQCAKRRPLSYNKTPEEKIAQHPKELKKKYRDYIKIRHRQSQADNASRVSSANSNISKTMSTRKPTKPQAGTSQSRQLSAKPNTFNASSIAASLATCSTATPTILKSKRTRKAPNHFGFESSVCSVNQKEPMPAPKRQKQNNPVIETVMQEEALQPPVVEPPFDLPVVSRAAPQPIGNVSPDEYSYADCNCELSISVFDAENQI